MKNWPFIREGPVFFMYILFFMFRQFSSNYLIYLGVKAARIVRGINQ